MQEYPSVIMQFPSQPGLFPLSHYYVIVRIPSPQTYEHLEVEYKLLIQV